MDDVALRLANALVGNAENTAALEITLRGPRLRFDADALIALTGAVIDARCATQEIPQWRPVWIPAGGEVDLGSMRRGARSYLAIAGGIDVAPALCSRSTDINAALGPFGDAASSPATTCRLAMNDSDFPGARWVDGHPAIAPDTTALPQRIGRSIPNRGSTRTATSPLRSRAAIISKISMRRRGERSLPANFASATNPTASAIGSKAASCGWRRHWNWSPRASFQARCSCRRTAIRSC
jgi:hypothetical protein